MLLYGDYYLFLSVYELFKDLAHIYSVSGYLVLFFPLRAITQQNSSLSRAQHSIN